MTPERWTEYYAANRDRLCERAAERHREKLPLEKVCERCSDVFFGLNGKRSPARLCPDCRVSRDRERKAAYKVRHRERVLEAAREYANKRYREDYLYAEGMRARSRARSGTQQRRDVDNRHYAKHRDAILEKRRLRYLVKRMPIYERDGGVCHICGELIPLDEFEIDHIIPISKGGSSESGNLAPAHRKCNRIKSNTLPGGMNG